MSGTDKVVLFGSFTEDETKLFQGQPGIRNTESVEKACELPVIQFGSLKFSVLSLEEVLNPVTEGAVRPPKSTYGQNKVAVAKGDTCSDKKETVTSGLPNGGPVLFNGSPAANVSSNNGVLKNVKKAEASVASAGPVNNVKKTEATANLAEPVNNVTQIGATVPSAGPVDNVKKTEATATSAEPVNNVTQIGATVPSAGPVNSKKTGAMVGSSGPVNNVKKTGVTIPVNNVEKTEAMVPLAGPVNKAKKTEAVVSPGQVKQARRSKNAEASRRCLSMSSGYDTGQVKVAVPARRRRRTPSPGNCVNVTIRILLGIAMLISVTNFMVKMYINLGPEHRSVFYMVSMECVAILVGGFFLFSWETE